MTVFSLRDVRVDDFPFLYDVYSDPNVRKMMLDDSVANYASHVDFWKRTLSSSKEERFLFTVDGERAGLAKIISLDLKNRNCKLGADIHERYRGKGYSYELWSLILTRCFMVHNLHRVSLETLDSNEVARHVYHKLGFREEGRQLDAVLRNDKFHDLVCMYLLKNDWLSKR